MYATSLRKAPHTRRFSIHRLAPSGWEVIDESDDGIVKRAIYHDWHRVERAIAIFEREEAVLREDGWVKAPA